MSRDGIDNGKARPKAEAVLLISPGEPRRDECRGVVSLNFVSWNRIGAWLRRIDGLRGLARVG